MNFAIIKLTFKQLPQLIKIINTALKEDFPEYPVRVSSIYQKHIFNKNYFRKFIKKKENIIFGAFVNKQLVGFLTIESDWGGVAYIDWLAVKKEFRNQGIGKSLLKTAENWCLKNYFHVVYLFTENNKNINFYQRRGFKYVGVHRNFWFGADEHLLQKILRDKPFEEMFKKYITTSEIS